MIEKKCEICGATFYVKPYRANKARFCSRRCGGVWHQSQRPHMGNRFKEGNNVRSGLRPANAFTSEQVSGESNAKWVPSVEFTCANCGEQFFRKPWIVRQNKSKSGYKFCCQSCKIQFMRGANHPKYVGGPVTYRGRGWLEQRKKAVERDNGTCQECGKVVGESISVHHIKPYREFSSPDEANRLENLICLCQACHMKHEPRLPRKTKTP